MLRLAQLQLVMATEERRGVDDIVEALLSETDAVPHDPKRPRLKGFVLASVLNNPGIASYLSNWVSLLARFRRVYHQEGDLGFVTPVQDIPTAAAFFSIGIFHLDSVNKLENVFDALSGLDNDERRKLLTPTDSSLQNYHHLIHYPWTARSLQPGFDAAKVVASYMKMGAQTDSWGLPALSVQCRIAVAVIMDKHLADTAGALRVLDEARTMFGYSSVLAQVFARIHHRSNHGTEALRYFRDTISKISMLEPVDAVFTTREAAVCAAECGEWSTACDWFLRAQATSDSFDVKDFGAVRVGLGADAAVASYQTGDLKKALKLLKNALRSLQSFEPDTNLQAAHCHRLVRHTILLVKGKVKGLNIQVAGKPIAMVPGACSNPKPVPAIKQHPLGHIDTHGVMIKTCV